VTIHAFVKTNAAVGEGEDDERELNAHMGIPK
jgi:hypothetical protein